MAANRAGSKGTGTIFIVDMAFLAGTLTMRQKNIPVLMFTGHVDERPISESYTLHVAFAVVCTHNDRGMYAVENVEKSDRCEDDCMKRLIECVGTIASRGSLSDSDGRLRECLEFLPEDLEMHLSSNLQRKYLYQYGIDIQYCPPVRYLTVNVE